MSKKHYPYLASKEKYKTDKKCSKCGTHAPGYKVTWEVSWFRGDDEVEQICHDCLKNVMAEHNAREQRQAAREMESAEREARFWGEMLARVQENYDVKILTPTQWRINGVVDVYPTNRRFHILKTNKRGGYRDVHRFLNDFFRPKLVIDNNVNNDNND